MKLFLFLSCVLNISFNVCKAEEYSPVEVNPYTKKLPKRMVLPENVEDKNWFEEHAAETLPSQILPNESGYAVLNKITDNGISTYWKNSELRNSSVGQAVETTEKKLNVQASIKDSDDVEHKFNFKVLAVQSLAKIEYSGWVKAVFNYDIRSANANTEIVEKLTQQQDIVVAHTFTNSDKKSSLSWRLNW